MSRRRTNKEPPVIPYKGYFVCRAGTAYRVKVEPTQRIAVGHTRFASAKEAMEFVDYLTSEMD